MGFKSERDREESERDGSNGYSSPSRGTADGSERGEVSNPESATNRPPLTRRNEATPKRRGEVAGSSTTPSNDRVAYDNGPDHEALSTRYGLEFVRAGQAQKIQRLENEFGDDRVGQWVDEGMTVETMGKPRDMQAFRERQNERPAEIPADVERQNEASIQRSARAAEDGSLAGEAGVSDAVREVVSSPGRALDETVQREMESKMDDSFGDVRIHTGPKAAAAAESIDARAFTVGNHVAFNEGEFRPETTEGQRVLAHELTHVRQQTDGRLSLLPKADSELAVDPDPALEREAERVARKVTAEHEPAGADSAATARLGTEMHVQRQPADAEETATSDDSQSSDSGEPEDAGPGINTDEAARVVAEVLRDWGIRAPPGMSLEEEYLHTGDSSDSIFLYMTGDNTPTPPAEWVIENTPGEGIAQGATKALTFRILIATEDEYWVQVSQTSLETGVIEYSRGGYTDRYDGELIKEQMAGLLSQLEGDGVEIGLPSEDVWMPSEDEASETDEETDTTETEDDSDSGVEGEERESEVEQKSDGEPSGETDDDDGTYTIQEGDTLWDIAEEHDVEGGWQRLWTYKDNEDVIGDDPDLIFPGDTIEIPAQPTENGDGSKRDESDESNGEQPIEVQPKLAVSSPSDPAEKEAERVASRVMKMDDVAEEDADEGHVARTQRDIGLIRTVPVTRSASGMAVSDDGETKVRQAVNGGGKKLSDETRSYFESRFGADFSDVAVHTGSEADEAARSINAKAFTMGSDIAFAKGNYDPGSHSGKELLAHELTHVVQQDSSRASGSHRNANAPSARAHRNINSVTPPSVYRQGGMSMEAEYETSGDVSETGVDFEDNEIVRASDRIDPSAMDAGDVAELVATLEALRDVTGSAAHKIADAADLLSEFNLDVLAQTGTAIGVLNTVTETLILFGDGQPGPAFVAIYEGAMGIGVGWAGLINSIQGIIGVVAPEVASDMEPFFDFLQLIDPIGLGEPIIDFLGTAGVALIMEGEISPQELNRLVDRMQDSSAGVFAEQGEELGDAIYQLAQEEDEIPWDLVIEQLEDDVQEAGRRQGTGYNPGEFWGNLVYEMFN